MTHLSADELIDAVEHTLGSERRAHVEQCTVCHGEIERLRAILGDAQSASSIPEPSPLFWNHFSQRVHAAIEAEAAPGRAWAPAWLRWRVLAPVAAIALVVVALITALPSNQGPTTPPGTLVNAGDPGDDLASLGEQEWALVADMVGPVDLDLVQDAGFMTLGDAERAALQLSAAEQRELLRLLQEEMDKAGG